MSRSLSGTKFLLPLFILFCFASCKKEGNIGTNVQASDELIDLKSKDLFPITYTMREDSVRSDLSPIIQIGNIYDPIFGKSTAALFTQLVIPNNLLDLSFGAGAQLDSTFLSLSYNYDFYGDTLTQQTFNVYQMIQNIYYDTAYYSNHPKQYYPIAVGTKTFSPCPRSRVIVGTDTMPPNLRIPINPNFAQQVFSQSGGNNLSSTANFIQYLKGLCITSETSGLNPGEGSILQFNAEDSLTRFTFYYHTPTQNSLTFSFVMYPSAAYYSYFTHDYSTAGGTINAQLSDPHPEQNNYSEVYVQSCAGLKTKIEFPFIDSLKNLPYKIAINQAQLVIKAEPQNASANFPINTQLYVVAIDSTGLTYLLTDMYENSSYFGGTVNTTNSEYTINIARYLQQLLNGEETHTKGLFLKEYSPILNARRAVIGSNNSSSGYRMYLHLVYTRIN